MKVTNMELLHRILTKEVKLSVIGLGYVGMPLAIAFAKKVNVIGFDVNQAKIELYQSGKDPTLEVGDEAIQATTVEFTCDEVRLKESLFHIIAVPTPINQDKTPNLMPVESASETVGRNLKKGSVVVYESTVYPGVTEDVCIPILEKVSGLKCGIDFKVGYSPERINPGDKVNTLSKIVKIVSAIDEKTCEEIAKVYELVIEAGVFRARSIKVAEAAKVVENSQRDINIAFMNELAMVFDRMGIDSMDVIEAMNTKWNALGFYPGLVGGHCIGVDPYYFIYEAEKLGYHSQIILSGRKINDGMGKFIADIVIRKLIKAGKIVNQSKVAIMGITFKENCPDIRNSKVIDIYKALDEYGVELVIVDPQADATETKLEYNVDLTEINQVKDLDGIIFAVAHDEFKSMNIDQIDILFKEMRNKEKVIVDVKSIMNGTILEERDYSYWRL